MKKQKQKKTVAKKDEKEPTPESSKSEESPAQTAPPVQDVDGTKEEEPGNSKSPEETVSDLNSTLHQRQPSLSLQSKMRSSSFRAASGGPLSPSYAPFSPDGDTAPDIYRKQALKIEELEKENKRLAKEASDGERRLQKAEEELEELREAQDDTSTRKGTSSESFGEVEKLVRLISCCVFMLLLTVLLREARSQPFNGRTYNSKPRPHEPHGMAPHPRYQSLLPQTTRLLSPPNLPLSNLWKLNFPLFVHTSTAWWLGLQKKSRLPLWKRSLPAVNAPLQPHSESSVT
jgi:hypothetical protein